MRKRETTRWRKISHMQNPPTSREDGRTVVVVKEGVSEAKGEREGKKIARRCEV